MNGLKIANILRLDPYARSKFSGYGCPDIPIVPPADKASLFILNTDESGGPGEHWCSVYFYDGVCDFFDSFGFPPSVYKLQGIFEGYVGKICFNSHQVQPLTSKTCGYYCIYFGLLRCRGYTLKEIIDTFVKTDIERNDELVTKCVMQFGNVYKLM